MEIGTAIGFSALLMAENSPNSQITTIDRNEEMIGFAKENFAKYDQRQQIELLEGKPWTFFRLYQMTHTILFSWILLNQNILYFTRSLEKVKVGGLIILDDIFQGGDVAKDIKDVRRGQRTIYKGLQRLFDATLDNPDVTASLISMSDGLLMLRKNRKMLT